MKTLVSLLTVLVLSIGKMYGQTYSVTDLGTFGGNSSIAYSINDSGQVVGGADMLNGFQHAFLYFNGGMQNLGTLDQNTGYGGNTSCATAINNSGQVAGYSDTRDVGSVRGFSYINNQMAPIPTLRLNSNVGGSGYNGYEYGINGGGQIVGYASIYSSVHSFLYQGGSTTDLGTFGAVTSQTLGINDLGQVIGYITTTVNHAFMSSGGLTLDLGTLGGPNSYAKAININGQVVGNADVDTQHQHAFSYLNGSLSDLGTLGGFNSKALGINAHGQIVGGSSIVDGKEHAFLYSNGQMLDLNNLVKANVGWTLEDAYAINASGQIVGDEINQSGQQHAFLLNPEPAPEPSVWMLGPLVAAFCFSGLKKVKK